MELELFLADTFNFVPYVLSFFGFAVLTYQFEQTIHGFDKLALTRYMSRDRHPPYITTLCLNNFSHCSGPRLLFLTIRTLSLSSDEEKEDTPPLSASMRPIRSKTSCF